MRGPCRPIVSWLLSAARRRATAASLASAVLVLVLLVPPVHGGGRPKNILGDATSADLPIQQPTRFELAVSVRAAKALGLTIPRPPFLQADHVLE